MTHESVSQSQNHEASLEQGNVLLAESITRAAEAGGTEAVLQYFEDTLSDTEAATPPAERQAVVSLLAHEQKASITDSLI